MPYAKAAPSALLRPSQLAARFGVTPQTVRRWLAEGRLSGWATPGGRLLILDNEQAATLMRPYGKAPMESATKNNAE